MSPRIPTLALVVAAALLAGCGGEASSPTTEETIPATSTASTGASTTSKEGGGEGAYPSAAREAFLDSCEGGSTPETCECALRYLEENVPLEEFVQAGIAISQGEAPPAAITKADESCQ